MGISNKIVHNFATARSRKILGIKSITAYWKYILLNFYGTFYFIMSEKRFFFINNLECKIFYRNNISARSKSKLHIDLYYALRIF